MKELIEAIDNDDLITIEKLLREEYINECLVYSIHIENIRVLDYLRRQVSDKEKYNKWIIELASMYKKEDIMTYMKVFS